MDSLLPGPSQGATDSISLREVAARLGVHERTVRRAIARGELPAGKRGRSLQIALAALEHYQTGRSQRPRLRADHSFQGQLSIPLTSFIGRAEEITHLERLMRRHSSRFITLTGPGGVGKTRLALQLLDRVAPLFPDGAVVVPLSAVTDPTLVLPTIAHALGLQSRDDQPPHEQVAQALSEKRLLLVLDNLEQVRAAGPELAMLVAACRGVVVLGTSRVLLRVAGEHRVPVSPLALPPDASSSHWGNRVASISAIAEAESVRLFMARAQAVIPDFALTDDHVADVAAICRRLDGIPLALELAAARLRHLCPADLLQRLDRALPLLTDGPADAPRRLQTMRAAIAWSYDLLSADEQALFRLVAVFINGSTLDAVETVVARCAATASADGTAWLDPATTLTLLSGLIDQNLVATSLDVSQQSGMRYTLLETVREYGLEQLATSGGEGRARDTHADWCVSLARQADRELTGACQAKWFNRLDMEQPNFRAALHWLLDRKDSERGLALVQALAWFWTSRGYLREASRWVAAFLDLPGAADSPLRGRVLMDAANIAQWQGDDAKAQALAKEALASFRKAENWRHAAYALRQLGSIAIDRRDLANAAVFLAESEAVLSTAATAWDTAFARYLGGRLAMAGGDVATAGRDFDEAAAAFRAIGDQEYVAAARCQQGAAELIRGQLARARPAYCEGLTIARDLEQPYWIACGLAGAAYLALEAMDRWRSFGLLAEAMHVLEEAGPRRLDDPVFQAVWERLGGSEFDTMRHSRPRSSQPAAIAEALAILGDARSRDDAETPTLAVSWLPRRLTPREHEVLRLLAQGRSDKEIASALRITRHTASNHVTAIRRKLAVPSRAAAAALAARSEIVW